MACSRSRHPCHCMLWVRGMSWSHYMHPIPSQVIWMAPHSNPICETCLLLATCFHGQNTVPCPPTHMASGHSTGMKLIKKVREVSEWYNDTQTAFWAPSAPRSPTHQELCLSKQEQGLKSGSGGRYLSQPRSSVPGPRGIARTSSIQTSGACNRVGSKQSLYGVFEIVVAIYRLLGNAYIPSHNGHGHPVIDGLWFHPH